MKFERVAGVMTVPSNTEWESLLDQFLQSLPDPAMIADLQGSIRFVNDGMLHLVRLSRDEAIGQPFPYPWLLPQGHLDKLPWVNEDRDFEGAARVESLVTDADGQHRIISFSITALPGPDGRVQWLLNIGRDITQQRNAEEMVENLEFDLIRVVEDMPAWVQLADLSGNIEMVNEAACAISEYDRSELIGQSWPYPWFQDNRSGGGSGLGAELPRAGQVLEFETICTTRQGHPKDLSVTLSRVAGGHDRSQRVLMVAQNITERKQTRDRLLQTEKIGAVSQLASGVAHDINNDLAVILGYSDYLLNKCENLDEPERHALSAIQQQAQECAGTVRRIQLFSRRVSRSKFTYFSVNDLVRDVAESTQLHWQNESNQTWTGIQLETDLAWVPPVHGHWASLKEAVAGLVHNAAAALPEGGKISMRTKSVAEDVVLEIVDDGVGIDPNTMRRIFEPFFTTKGPASSGLGLSIAYNLITQMDGILSVETDQEAGTRFTIRLPAASGDLTTSTHVKGAPERKRILEVLVVDDEPLVAGMLKTFLETAGHRVSVFLDGAEALEAFENGEFDLAIVDLGMPGIDGWEVSRRINELRRDVPIIVATGWNMTVQDGEDHGAVIDMVLRKPFDMSGLADSIEEVNKRRQAV